MAEGGLVNDHNRAHVKMKELVNHMSDEQKGRWKELWNAVPDDYFRNEPFLFVGLALYVSRGRYQMAGDTVNATRKLNGMEPIEWEWP